MAWPAFMDFVEEKLASDKFRALNAKYADWKIADIEDLRDRKPGVSTAAIAASRKTRDDIAFAAMRLRLSLTLPLGLDRLRNARRSIPHGPNAD